MEKDESGQKSFTTVEPIKIAELHRHHDTSHTPESILRVSQALDIEPFKSMNIGEIRRMVQSPKGVDFNTWYEYLKKVRLAYISPKAVAELTRDVILDAAEEGIDLLELRVSLLSTVDAILAHQTGRNFWEVARETIENIIQIIEETRSRIQTDLIMSITCANKNLPQIDDYGKLLLDYAQYIIGIDLTNERDNPPSRYREVIEHLRGAIKFLTVHCMETQGPERGWDVLTLNPDRIGHGIRAIEDCALMDAIKEHHIPLEICPLSNMMTGVATPKTHPFKTFDDAGLTLAICADGLNDGTTLADNYRFVQETFGYSNEDMDRFKRNAWEHAFRNKNNRQ